LQIYLLAFAKLFLSNTSLFLAMQQEWFKDWFNTPYYHLLYNNRDKTEAATFIDNLIHFLQPAASASMLDVACGKGRHALHLAQKGFNVVGVDLSDQSITAAQQLQQDNLSFFTHDMRLPFYINYFNYVFNFFTSFGYFTTLNEHYRAINSLQKSLKKDGVFVIDYLNSHVVQKNLVPKTELHINNILFKITRKVEGLHFYKTIEVVDNALPQALFFEEKVAKFTLENFTDMFAKTGLQIVHTFGNYHLDAFDVETSPRLIMVAKKQ
jgi:SAM-dependent methyltransferase